MMDLFINLMIAHVVGDFFCQTQKSCHRKLNKGLSCVDMYIHAVIIFVLSWTVVWQYSFGRVAFVIAVVHLLIDTLKVELEKKIKVKNGDGRKICLGESRFGIYPFVVDQLLHVIVIFVISDCWLQSNIWNQFAFMDKIGIKNVDFILALMICWKPANILIRYILGYCKVKGLQGDEELSSFKSGALIGTLERWLILFFMCLQQYEAIGFLITAKSILRFSEMKKSEKSEYVLAGTLLSLTIALGCGWVVIHVKHI